MGFGGGVATPLVTPANPSTLLVNHETDTALICTVVYCDAVGGFARAKADVLATSAVIGVISDLAIASGALGGVQVVGVVIGTTAQWDAVTGDAGGLQAVPYYVSATTAGMLTRTKPAIGVQVGTGLSATELLMTPGTASSGGGGGGGSSNVIDVRAAPYNATGNGVADDTAALQSALTASAASGLPVWLGGEQYTYKVSHTGGSDINNNYCLLWQTAGFKLIADGATIRFPSTTDNCFRFDTAAAKAVVDGVRFQGDNDDSYIDNNGAGMWFLGTVNDVTIKNCEFSQCIPEFFASDGTVPGRFIFTDNRVLNAPGACDSPYRSIITGNIFDCDTKPGTRSHMIYMSGATDGSVIANNIFRHCDSSPGTYAIQIRATASRYGNRQGFVIADNMFYGCSGGMWIGSDNDTVNSGYSVTGNTFRDCDACVFAYGLKDSTIGPNTIISTWEHASGISACIQVISGSPLFSGQLSKSVGVNVTGNVIANLHPWFGIVDVTTLPTAGHTVTVGGVTYTWRASASTTGDITIGADTTAAAQNLGAALRGDANNAINPVLRDGQDAMFDPYVYDGSLTNRVIIASYTTFALTQSNSELTLTAAAAHNAYPAAGILIQNTFGTKVANNVLRDLTGGIQVSGSRDPTINDNEMHGSSIIGHANVYSKYKGNRFHHTPFTLGNANTRWLTITDGFYDEDDNGIGSTTASQQRDVTGGARSQIVPVGDGTARVRMYYGTEYLQGSQPDANNSLPFRWTNGDTVVITNGTTIAHTFTFQRTSPGAGQFNTADSLIALVNATIDFTAAYVSWFDSGGDVNPKQMIEFVHSPGGTAGNACYLEVVPINADGPNLPMIRTVGVLLLNAGASDGSQSFLTWFQGGSAAADKTVIWSPIVSTVRGMTVYGVDSTSQALAPIAYLADIVQSVCAVITHTAAAGTEKFFVRVN